MNEQLENYVGTHIVYLVRPKTVFMKWIANHIKQFRERGENRTFSIIFVPRSTILCERALEEEGVYSQVKIGEYHVDLFPLDVDLLSLEQIDCFRDCFIEGDRTSLFYVAKALMRLQTMFGIIPQIKGKGYASQNVASMMLRMRLEMRASDIQVEYPSISQLFLIDRTADPVTPITTMLTYEGLVDEFFGINHSFVELPYDLFVDNNEKPDPNAPKFKKIVLNSNDRIFRDIRDVNFSQVGPILNAKAKYINEYYKNNSSSRQLHEIKEFAKNLRTFQEEHQRLRIHTNIVEVLLNYTRDIDFHTQLEAEQNMLADGNVEMSLQYIEDCIYKQEPIVKVLRLLCLYSLTNGGLKEKQYAFFVKEIVQSYGYVFYFALENLSYLGMLRKQDRKIPNWFATLRKQRDFKLIDNDVDEQNPNDINYVFSGFAPPSVRMVDLALRHSSIKPQGNTGMEGVLREGWGLPRNIEECIRILPGSTFHATQAPMSNEVFPSQLNKKDVILVFFIGGVTFPEISALRFLSQKYENKSIIVATTNIINSNSFMEEIFEKFEPPQK